MSEGISVHRLPINSIDCLNQPIADADVEIVQLGNGQLNGSLTKVLLPNLAFSRTDFSLPLRTSGILGTTNLTICMLMNSSSRSTSWGRELRQGDLFFSAPGSNFDAVFGEKTEAAGISISPDQLGAMFGGEPALADVGYWMQNHQFACHPQLRPAIVGRIREIATWFEDGGTMSATAADFWQRCLVEAFTAVLTYSLPPAGGRPIPSALHLVREVEHYLDLHLHRAVHVSEICAALNVSRRTLHRAFHDVLGIGPIAFLRHHRLCAVHRLLRQGDPATTYVTEVATEFGFLELGRFARYYAALFGEYPSQTLRGGPGVSRVKRAESVQ